MGRTKPATNKVDDETKASIQLQMATKGINKEDKTHKSKKDSKVSFRHFIIKSSLPRNTCFSEETFKTRQEEVK